MKECVLILGAAALQVPLIKFVKNRGYRIIVVSIPGDYPGFAFADRSIYRDVRDGVGILSEVSEENIVAVITDETDVAVPTVAFIASKLGLAGNDVETAITYSNKFKMRKVCQNIGVSVPNFFHASDIQTMVEKLNQIRFPAIMKPEDNQGSRGIYMIQSVEEAVSHFKDCLNYSCSGAIIVEQMFQGKEVVVEGFVINGNYLNWGIGERRYFHLNNMFIPSQTIFPANIPPKIMQTLLNAEKMLHTNLKPTFGMIHSEYLYNEETGEYILVETALRGGGVYISSHLVPFYTGYNNYNLLFNCSLGNIPNLDSISKQLQHYASAYVCFYLPEGEVVKVSGVNEIKKIPEVKLAEINVSYGQHIKKMQNKTMRLGPIIISGRNRTDIEKTICKVQNVLKITVVKEDGSMGGIIWE